MKFLTFDNLLDKNIHINKLDNFKKIDNNLYKVINDSCILNLTYTSICLYKIYKVFYILNSKKSYVTLINNCKLYNNKYINLLLKFTSNNIFNGNDWVNGIITNNYIIKNILILGLWLEKLYLKSSYKKRDIPSYIYNIKNKVENICNNLKFKYFSKFVFIFNLNYDKNIINECFYSNKFIMGITNSNTFCKLIDFYIFSNNVNEISLNFIVKFLIIASINGNFLKHK